MGMTNTNTMQVAETIRQQLGGSRFSVMTGATNYCGSENSLSFKIGRNAAKVTHVRIVLNAMDTYDVSFLNVRGTTLKTIKTVAGVYAEDLRQVFTESTGMRTSL